MSEFFMGVDIGTTSTKAVLFDENGSQVTRYAVHYNLATDVSGKAEQNPDEIFEAVKKAIWMVMSASRIGQNELAAISFSAAMHSLILVDKTGSPLTNCITWADSRSSAALETAKRHYYLEGIYEKTGTPIHPMSPFAKLIWLSETAPEKMAAMHMTCGIKSYVLYKMFGKWLIDASLASASGLYNTKAGCYEKSALEIAQLSQNKLPTVVSELHQLSGLSTELASEMGIAPGTVFVVGASDGALANLGLQATAPNDVTVTVGTSGAVRKTTTTFQTDGRSRTFCYRLTDGLFIQGGAVNNGGKAIEWAMEQFAPQDVRENRDYVKLMQNAAEVPLGSNGLLFLPYLLGERAPYWTSDIRAAFLGITINHTPPEFLRAAIEGIALNLASVYSSMGEKGDVVYVSGGIAAHTFWCSLLADILNREVRVTHTIEGSSLGAALLAMKSLGRRASFTLPKKPAIKAVYRPNVERAKAYAELHKIFELATVQLTGINKQLIDWQKNVTK
ncbi:gluconokinase [Listeria sp. ILCC797]|uniref:gluconokinase n=1 Tax=Listeria sp. ILCC797 TaxID=1918333 RepID=UPI000B58F0CC|nr:gluconokinase [Listeria sp. ILCC797]